MAQDTATKDKQNFPTTEDFEKLLNETLPEQDGFEGEVVKGRVVDIENDYAVVDVGLKAEGRIPMREFGAQTEDNKLSVGDEVEVFVERLENAFGEAILSREKARREEAWEKLEQAYEKEERVEGVIFGRVKGGFTVDLSGAVAFLPGSQVDIRPVRDITPLMDIAQPFQILKMDRRRGNIVVSRRAVLEEDRAEQRSEILEDLQEGQEVEGVVKNVTEYGAFVDLGGIDGLLHVTDMSWKRVNDPNDVVSVGDTIRVQIVRINEENQRISLGMKQLEDDPWEGVAAKYPVGTVFKGKVTNITDYGAFVELETGVEGLVHVSEMSWTKKNIHPGKIVSTSQEIDVMVLDVDEDKRRISLGIKQVADNPWERFAESHPKGTEVEGEVKNITEFGLFLGLDEELDGMVHLSDLDWEESGDKAIKEYKKGDMVKAVVLDTDVEKERISLGIKQLSDDPFNKIARSGKKTVVTCTVSKVQDNGIEVKVGDTEITAFIRRSDLSRDRNEQRPDRFDVGEKVDALVTNVDRSSRRLSLSIKALEISEEKEAVRQYGSTDSGASLGDILGAALKEAREPGESGKEDKKEDKKAEKKSKPAAKKPAAKKQDDKKDESKKDGKKPAGKTAAKTAKTEEKKKSSSTARKKSAKSAKTDDKKDKKAAKPAAKKTAKKSSKKADAKKDD